MGKTYKRGDLFAVLVQSTGKIVLDYLVVFVHGDKSFRALAPGLSNSFYAFNNVGECRSDGLLALQDDDPFVIAESERRETTRLRARLNEWVGNVTLQDLRGVCAHLRLEV